MAKYMVLYRQESVMSPLDEPFGFACHADSVDHAEEQCQDAYPDCDVVWVVENVDYQGALENYWGQG